MKKISVFFVIAAIGMMAVSCGGGYNANVKMKTDADSALYALGILQGTQFREGLKTVPGLEDVDNYQALIAGMAVALNNKVSELKMTPEEAQAYWQTFVMGAQAKDLEITKAEGDAFLAANRSKPGVITTESGLQYKVITEGTGKKPLATDNVIVHYTLRLLDGTVLQSSNDTGEPITFNLGQVIRGWGEALQLMPVGSKYQLWIPSDLAYGEQGSGGIKPNSTLDFEVELLGIAE